MIPIRPWIAGLALVSVVAACEAREEVPPVEETTSPGGAFDGMTPEEIRMQAEPMSPEVAESLGIVDTSIHLEEQLGEDTITIRRDSVPPVNRNP